MFNKTINFLFKFLLQIRIYCTQFIFNSITNKGLQQGQNQMAKSIQTSYLEQTVKDIQKNNKLFSIFSKVMLCIVGGGGGLICYNTVYTLKRESFKTEKFDITKQVHKTDSSQNVISNAKLKIFH